ncbi:energy transducer TonB [Cyclobacterium jeungdonense]|uniref:Energy transducer TonB n=1 Tax=Cyclobacterium jeungdonense TaxID=708087 RepID=A0ABT8C5V1_9BACT|nr:energy transducer TonB [Cyclobacterium jeungdonense]MDN3687472.1 energy transducer TonB [Cyclobacterium jeungdonense]
MKISILSCLLTVLLNFPGISQKLDKITVRTKNPSKVATYQVLKDQTTKHGPAVIKYRGTLGFHEQGHFTQGERTGVWEYFDAQGDLVQKFNFSTKSFELLKDFTSVKEVYILQGEDLVQVNTGARPVLLGGDAKFYYFLANNLQYPSSALSKGISGTVGVIVTITKEGKMVNPFIPKEGDKDLDKEALRVISLIPDEWVPLKIDGTTMDSLALLYIRFQRG